MGFKKLAFHHDGTNTGFVDKNLKFYMITRTSNLGITQGTLVEIADNVKDFYMSAAVTYLKTNGDLYFFGYLMCNSNYSISKNHTSDTTIYKENPLLIDTNVEYILYNTHMGILYVKSDGTYGVGQTILGSNRGYPTRYSYTKYIKYAKAADAEYLLDASGILFSRGFYYGTKDWKDTMYDYKSACVGLLDNRPQNSMNKEGNIASDVKLLSNNSEDSFSFMTNSGLIYSLGRKVKTSSNETNTCYFRPTYEYSIPSNVDYLVKLTNNSIGYIKNNELWSLGHYGNSYAFDNVSSNNYFSTFTKSNKTALYMGTHNNMVLYTFTANGEVRIWGDKGGFYNNYWVGDTVQNYLIKSDIYTGDLFGILDVKLPDNTNITGNFNGYNSSGDQTVYYYKCVIKRESSNWNVVNYVCYYIIILVFISLFLTSLYLRSIHFIIKLSVPFGTDHI